MNNILYYYGSSDVIKLFKTKGKSAFVDDNVVGFIYKDCNNPMDAMHYDYDSVYMSKYSKKSDAYIMDVDLKAKDLKALIEKGFIKFEKTEGKNQMALKLFECIFPSYFKYKKGPVVGPKPKIPNQMLNTGIFISKDEWKTLKSSGKIPDELRRLL